MSATLITQIRKDHDDIHIKTYTRWLNWKLGKAGPVVKNLIEDLQDGRVLISLARVLLKVKINAESTDSEIHQRINVQKALDVFMKHRVKLVAIHASRVVSGDQATILALVWNIILRFQIPGDNNMIKERLLKWVQDVLQGYSDIVIVEDILESWQNGLAFILLMFVYRPNVVDIAKARKMSVVARMEYAFLVAKKEFGVDRFFDPVDVEQRNLKEDSMLMYLSALYEVLMNLNPLRVTLKCPNYDEWKESVAELERILDREEAKFVPNSDIKKEFSNLERLAQETKDSGEIVESVCKPKLATISSVGKELIDSKELDASNDKNIAKKIDELTDRIQRLDTAVRETRERVREAVLEYIVKTLNELSVKVKVMQETSSSLNPPANNLPRVRVQITTLKVMLMMTVVIIVIMTVIMIGYSDCAVNGWLLMMILVCLAMMTLLTMSLEQQHSTSVAKIQDTKGKVKKMVDAGVMTEGDSAGMSDEKEKIKNIADVIEDAEPKLIKRYIELLQREIEKRKQWLDVNEEEIIRSKVDFKDFSELKVVYSRIKDLAKELDDNNVHVLIEETNKFDGIEEDLKQQLVVLNERWTKMDVALRDKNELYDNLMADWTKYREQQLIFLNWIDEKDSEVKNEKDQVNLADEDEISAHITKLKDVENKAESEGALKERNLREAGEDLIRHIGEDSPTAVEICKQTEEIVSVKHEFLKDLSVRIQKIESSDQKTQDLYNDFDDVTDWLDATESLIDKYESHDKETADDDSPREQLMPQDEEVEEMASVAEEIMINFEKLSETDLKVKHVNTLGNELKEEIADEGREGVDAKLDAFNQRYNNVSQRIKDFENKEPQTSSGCSEFVRRIRRKLFQVFK